MPISIIDYGVGNIGSIRNMLKKIGADSVVASTAAELASATKIVLPGVGAFDQGMEQIRNRGLHDALKRKVEVESTPLLGICLGMQLLAQGSEEGELAGFGWIPSKVRRLSFDPAERRKIPHMGWNTISIVEPHPLLSDLGDDARFYFVHSYHLPVHRSQYTLAVTNYGGEFSCVVGSGSVMGVQFHPEKSHKFGMALLRNFEKNY